MKIRIFAALFLVWAAVLCGQGRTKSGPRSRFRWQDYCFDHPAAPFCPGHEYAIKHPAPGKDAATPQSVVTDPFPPASQNVTPSVIIVGGGIDWRFADPLSDALAGLNIRGLSASPLARDLIVRLGANQGLNAVDVQKIFDGLSGVDQVALSIRDNQIVVMATGRVSDLTLPAPGAGLKTVRVSGDAMLSAHAGAVDQAVQRIERKGPPAELTRLAGERQANNEFWAEASAGFVGPQAVNEGVMRFSLTVSVQNRLTSDVAVEFNGAPSRETLRMWRATLGDFTLESNVAHVRVSMEAAEARQKFSQIADGPLGQRLAALVNAARYLPVRDATIPRPARPVIYGLDGGPQEVNQGPNR